MNMSKELKKDWLPKLQVRYSRRNREGKSRMLDELCDDYKYERKYAIKLLSGGVAAASGKVHPGPERRYGEIQSVVQHIWLTAEPTSAVSEAVHAAFPFLETLFCPWGERSASAQVRSFFVSGPPVCRRASCSISLHPAASKRATPTACFTKAETFTAAPAAISARISSS